MADNFSLDDILAEVDKKREKHGTSRTGDSTPISITTELDSISKKHRRAATGENPEASKPTAKSPSKPSNQKLPKQKPERRPQPLSPEPQSTPIIDKHKDTKNPPITAKTANTKKTTPPQMSVTEILDTEKIRQLEEKPRDKAPARVNDIHKNEVGKPTQSQDGNEIRLKKLPAVEGVTEILDSAAIKAKSREKNSQSRAKGNRPKPVFGNVQDNQDKHTEIAANTAKQVSEDIKLKKPSISPPPSQKPSASAPKGKKPPSFIDMLGNSGSPTVKPTPDRKVRKKSDVFYEKAKPLPQPLIEDISQVREEEVVQEVKPYVGSAPEFKINSDTTVFDKKRGRNPTDTDNIEIFDDGFVPPKFQSTQFVLPNVMQNKEIPSPAAHKTEDSGQTMVLAPQKPIAVPISENPEILQKIKDESVLKQDKETELPIELIESINPYDVKRRANEESNRVRNEQTVDIEFDLSGDTQGIAGDDLKNIAERVAEEKISAISTAEMDVKAYVPSTEKSAEPEPEVETKITHSNTALIESLNKAIKERRENEKKVNSAMFTMSSGDINIGGAVPMGSNVLNIDYKTQILKDTTILPAVGDPIENEKQIQSLSAKRKRKISDFVLEEAAEDEGVVDENDEDDDYEGFDVSEQIWSDLVESHRGLNVRFFILLILTAFITIVSVCNDLGVHMAYRIGGFDMVFLDHRFNAAGYLLMQLLVGVAGLATCSSVVTKGLSKLFTGKGDCDSICAMSSVVSVLGVIPVMANPDLMRTEKTHVFVAAGLCALLFNTIGKLLMIRRAKRNFRVVSGDHAKYYAEIIEDDEVSAAFTKGAMSELPVLASMHKTEFLTDFLKSSYCNDVADKYSKTLTPISLGVAVLLGLIAYFLPVGSVELRHSISWAVTVAVGVLSAFSSFSIMFVVNYPLERASRALSKRDAAVLGYNAAVSFSDVNAIMLDASLLFPAGSIAFCNIKRCQKKNTLNAIAIDEAIITAASLAIKCNSVLSSMFYDMIAGRSEMLYEVENCIYEVNMGITGWIGNRRIMLGNREQMKHHDIPIPDVKVERKYSTPKGDVVYLAVSGEAVAMFFIEVVPNPEIKIWMQELNRNDMALSIRTRDSLVTVAKVADVFDISPERIKILPFNMHGKFDECTRYTSRGNGSVCCNGTFTSLAGALIGAKGLVKDISLTSILIFVSSFLALILGTVFMLFQLVQFFTPTTVILYNLAWLVLMLILQSFRKYG